MVKIFTLGLFLLFSGTVVGAEKREISVILSTPDSAWKIAIEEIFIVKKELWVISRLSRDPKVIGASVISRVKDSVKISPSKFPVKHFVLGKTWGWKNKGAFSFIKGLQQIKKDLNSGKLVYRKKGKS